MDPWFVHGSGSLTISSKWSQCHENVLINFHYVWPVAFYVIFQNKQEINPKSIIKGTKSLPSLVSGVLNKVTHVNIDTPTYINACSLLPSPIHTLTHSLSHANKRQKYSKEICLGKKSQTFMLWVSLSVRLMDNFIGTNVGKCPSIVNTYFTIFMRILDLITTYYMLATHLIYLKSISITQFSYHNLKVL